MTATSVTCMLQMPHQDHLLDHLKLNAKRIKSPKQMIQANLNPGQTVVICGAGPSLAAQHEDLRAFKAHQVWGCNSALPYLIDHHLPVTHGFAVDQGTEMLNPEEWQRTFPVTYLIASSVHPTLVKHLETANRRIRWFHNYLGVKDPEDWTPPASWNRPHPNAGYEMYLYQTIFPPSVQVGYGLNSVPRAICLAIWMGFKTIRVYGADCAALPDGQPMPRVGAAHYPDWLDQVRLYADGRTARHYGDQAVMVEAQIEQRHGVGPIRRWHTRADMVISAVHLVDLAKTYPDRITLVGDTLPNAMMDKPKEWFDRVPKLTGQGGISGFAMAEELTPVPEREHA